MIIDISCWYHSSQFMLKYFQDHPQMAVNLRDPGLIPGGDPKRFQDSSNYVFYIVGECFSSAADTHLATDLTC